MIMQDNEKKPALRFKGFTDPWEQRKLGELSRSFEYGLNAAAKEYDGQNKYLRITDIDDTSRQFVSADITSPDANLAEADNYRLSDGDVLFARTGASVGKTYLYKKSDGLVYFAGFLIRAKIKESVSAGFIFQNTLTRSYERYIAITSQRSGQPGVNAQEYAEYQLMLPELFEQEKIAKLLEALDTLITLHQRKYEKLVNIKKSMLDKMFPKNGASVPEIRFKGFTDLWEQRKLGEIAVEKLSNGVMNHPASNATGVRHINVINMYTPDKIHLEDLTFSSYDGDVIQKCNVEIGDIFLTRSSLKPEGIAEANVLLDDGRFIYDDHLIRLKINKNEYVPLFVKINLGVPFIKVQFISKSKTTAFTTIGQDDISECVGLFPEKEEQQKIAIFFHNLNTLITLHQRKLEKLQNIKKSCLEKMFV